jgi:hypothetical protein
MARMPFEWKLEGHICSDNAVGAHKISLFVRLKTLVASGIFWILFFAVEKEYLARRIRDKTIREDGAQRAFCF